LSEAQGRNATQADDCGDGVTAETVPSHTGDEKKVGVWERTPERGEGYRLQVLGITPGCRQAKNERE